MSVSTTNSAATALEQSAVPATDSLISKPGRSL